jgi:rod shape-determining protein MreD
LIRIENLRIPFIALGILATQIILLRHLKIYGSESDLVLLFILWLCTKQSKTECLIYAGILGFSLDAMTDLWGLHMFSKTLTVFILHGFLNRIYGNRFIIWQIFLIILGAALVHNCIIMVVSLFAEAYATSNVGWSFVLIGSVFTAILGSFLHLVRVD